MAVVLRALLVALIAALITGGSARAAQAPNTTRGQLTVVVTDTTGATVADAAVLLTRGPERRARTTGNDGLAQLPNLAAGTWTLTVTRDGFARWQQPVTIEAGVIQVPVGLTVAGLTESVQVESTVGPATSVPLNATVIGIWRYSLSGRFRLKRVPSHSPYAGWMKWHHYVGLIFGFFAGTWAFSGALSLSPFDFLRASPMTVAQRQAATGGLIDLEPLAIDGLRRAAAVVGQSFTPKELDFFQFQGEPYFIAYVPPSPSEAAPWRNSDISAATALNIDREHVLVSALRPEDGTFTRFENDRMWDVAKAAMPGVPMQDATWMHEYDAYYYSQKGSRPLPVLRVRYADPPETWLYLDPQHGVIASRLERASRWNRWLYHGFHSLDFPFLYYKRPLWDIVVILLSLGGIAMSVTTALPAWRRLRRHAVAFSRWALPHEPVARPPLPEMASGTIASHDQVAVDSYRRSADA